MRAPGFKHLTEPEETLPQQRCQNRQQNRGYFSAFQQQKGSRKCNLQWAKKDIQKPHGTHEGAPCAKRQIRRRPRREMSTFNGCVEEVAATMLGFASADFKKELKKNNGSITQS